MIKFEVIDDELDEARSGAIRSIVGNSMGGVGKTTFAAGLAAFYARKKDSVKVFDFDPQSDLSN